jgi:VCBS repeat protein/fibronectin type III domain protein/FG-GAP repeat protein
MVLNTSRLVPLLMGLALLGALGGCGGDNGGLRDSGLDGSQDGATDAGLKHDGGVDAGGSDVAPPAELTAAVLDRRQTSFQLDWTAPAAAIGAVAGYQVRYAKVAITSTNFNDTTVTTAVPFTTTPAAPTSRESIVIKDLYIESGYYFAVAALDTSGTQIWMQATAAPAAAHFNLTEFPSTAAGAEELGYSLSADGDLNGDGLSDILAGTYQGGKAYLFLGSPTVAGGVPSVVFSGASAGFGNAVAQIGDVDHDGLPDLAISDPINAVKVYIYKGRLTWPMTLSDTDADYVVSGDATYTGSLLGTSLTRLGDFTGDGVDDFAIGARGFGTSVGRVVIIPGKSTGFASVTLPDLTNSIVIDGDATLGKPAFGYRVLGLGHFYSVTTGTTLVASSPGLASNATSNMGHVYVLHGQAGSGGTIPLTAADEVIAGSTAGMRIGLVLSNLGPLLGTLPAVGIGNPADTIGFPGVTGTGYAAHGAAGSGPLASQLIVSLTGGTGVGGVILGGGIPGRDGMLSLIGDASPDFVLGSEPGTVLTILDGAKLAGKTAPLDASTVAEVKISLPSGWANGEGAASLIPDINGDGVPDLCVGNAFASSAGAVAVYW